jgi:hypothetical protein
VPVGAPGAPTPCCTRRTAGPRPHARLPEARALLRSHASRPRVHQGASRSVPTLCRAATRVVPHCRAARRASRLPRSVPPLARQDVSPERTTAYKRGGRPPCVRRPLPASPEPLRSSPSARPRRAPPCALPRRGTTPKPAPQTVGELPELPVRLPRPRPCRSRRHSGWHRSPPLNVALNAKR